jgi:hypothetical protein
MSSRRLRKIFKNRVLPFFKRIWLNEILVFGDSHAQVFYHRRIKECMDGCFFNIYKVGGATASGLANPNSKTRAYQVYRRALENSRARAVVVLLGEVDTGFVIWYRAQKYNEPIRAMLDLTLETYSKFLLEIKKQGLGVVVISAPLPTIQDGNDWGDIAKARREVKASLRDRTDLTLEFNRRVHAFCVQNNLIFVNLDPHCLDESGLVSPRLLSSDRNNHHYEVGVYADLMAPHIADSLKYILGRQKTRDS